MRRIIVPLEQPNQSAFDRPVQIPDGRVFTLGDKISLVEFDPDHPGVEAQQIRTLQEVLNSPDATPQVKIGAIGVDILNARQASTTPEQLLKEDVPTSNQAYMDQIAQ